LPARPLPALTDEPILDLQFEPVTPELARADGLSVEAGAIVRSVTAGGAAERSGLQVGDVIRRVNDLPVDEAHTLDDAILAQHVHGSLSLTVWRQGEELTIQVDLTGARDDLQS
jgi:S1-C subfamily serine protease